MSIRLPKLLLIFAAIAGLAGCEEPHSGPVRVSAVGPPPILVNPNLEPVSPATALLLKATAQGLVRFDSSGEIEPALAQSWIVSDDGLRYTFRLRRTNWSNGQKVTAAQVVSRLKAAASRASRNPLKPILGAVTDVVAMTDEVLEISLSGPRPNFLQLLAQPEMAILLRERGTGPLLVGEVGEAGTLLVPPPLDDEEAAAEELGPSFLLRGEPAAIAVARFVEGEADAVFGGTLADLPLARAADLPGERLQFDPVSGLFGIAFTTIEGPLGEVEIREALSMAVDRQRLVAALGVPGLAPRLSLVPPNIGELVDPSLPSWAPSPLPMRRALAGRRIAGLGLAEPLRLRLALPQGQGYRIVFAHLRHDFRLVGVELERVAEDDPAELRLVDRVAPALLAPWYLRQFTCDAGPICDPAADSALQSAREALLPGERRSQLVAANDILTELHPFIPLTGPVRWSLVSPRLTGFRPNPFGHHPLTELIAETRR